MIMPEELCKASDLAKQPVAFKKHYFKYVLDPKRTFYWTEKTDGLRSVLVVYDGCLYLRKKKEYILLDGSFPSRDTLVLDSEYYEDRYYIFDCYYLNGDISESSFEERYGLFAKWLENVGYPLFCLKEFSVIRGRTDLDRAAELLFAERSSVSGNRIDGVIIQDNSGVKTSIQYKWKRSRLITTDFYTRYNAGSGCYLLYVMGDEGHCKPLKQISRNNTISVDGVTLRPISVPLKENLHIFRPRSVFDTEGYFRKETEEIDRLMSVAKNNPGLFGERIVEMSPANDGWVPLRIRDDKVLPNSYKTAFDNILSYFEYPAFFEDGQYYETSENNAETGLVHNISHSMRDCQFEHLARFLPAGANSILDIGSGRGGDFERIVDMGLNCVFGVDDIFNCAKYAIRANRDERICDLNLIPGLIGADNSSVLADIRSRAEFPAGGFHVFNMDYAIHYVLDIPGGLAGLRDFIRSLAGPEAVFIFTAFDGDRMVRDAEKQPLRFGDLTITVDHENLTAKMILPTIKKEEKTERLFTEKDFKELGFPLLESFYPLCEKEEEFTENDKAQGLFRYYRYMRAYIVSVRG